MIALRKEKARLLQRQPRRPIAWVVVGLEVLLGVGALFGGGALLLAPDGHLLSMPTSVLANSPFTDFLVPGLILFTVNGVAPLVAASLTIWRPSLAPLAAVGIGVAVIGWIVVEMVILAGWGSLAWSFYLLLGAAIA